MSHYPKIPQRVHPDFKNKAIPIKECGEALVNIGAYSFKHLIEAPMYHRMKVADALPHCYVRESIIHLLEEAGQHLPAGFRFVIWDGYRPYHVQEAIYNDFYQKLKKKFPNETEKSIKERTENFVSYPSMNPTSPAPHITGGAIDLTIQNNHGEWLDFGTGFDDFSEVANTAYYERKCEQQKLTDHEHTILENRRFLYQLLSDVGFTNYHQEWWHFDYGNQWWAQRKEETAAIYGVAEFREEV